MSKSRPIELKNLSEASVAHMYIPTPIDPGPKPFEKPIIRVSIAGGVIEDNRALYGMEAGKERTMDQTQREEIRKLYLQGCSTDYIAHKLGLDPGNVGKVIGGMKRWEKPADPMLDTEAITPKAQPLPEPSFTLMIEGPVVRPGEAEEFAAKVMDAVNAPTQPSTPAEIKCECKAPSNPLLIKERITEAVIGVCSNADMTRLEGKWKRRARISLGASGLIDDIKKRFPNDPDKALQVANRALEPLEEDYREAEA